MTPWSAQAAEMRRVTKVPPVIASLTASPNGLAAALPGALGLDAQSSLTVRATNPLPNRSGRTVRLDQTYRGIPVWNQQVVVQLSPANEIVHIRGTAVFDIGGQAPEPTPALTAANALNRVKDIVSRESKPPYRLKYDNQETALVYYLQGRELRLAYRVSFYTDLRDSAGNPRPTRPVYFIDANSGETIRHYENIQHAALGTGPGGNTKTGQWNWGSSAVFPKFQVQQAGTTCTLDDGAHVFAENLDHGTGGTMTPFAFTCFNNTFQTINGGFSPLNDAQSFGLALYNMYNTWYGIPPISQKLWLRVHYGNNYENASWNGTSMLFGDGASTFFPLVGLDVMGHEVSHGFTEQHSGLLYQRQSGGMNEAFSDMAGEALEYFYSQTYGALFPRAMPDYNVGGEVFKASGQALRYMCDPPLDGISIDQARDFYYPLNVHYTSGVYNKAFCLLAKTPGWGPKKAFDLFELANESYWTANETYRTGLDGLVQAAGVLHFSEQDLRAAFGQVGVVPLPTQDGNDAFANAVVIRSGQTSVQGSNVGATPEAGEPFVANGGGATVWWKCIATTTGSATIDTLGSNVDTELGVYTGSAVAALSLVVQNGDIDANDNWASRVTFNAVAGTTYMIAVDGYNYPPADQGELRLNLTGLRCAGDRADFDGDTRSDLLFRHTSGQLALWELLGTQVKSKLKIGPPPSTAWQIVGSGDFDGDGNADILFRHSDGTVALWLLDGATVKSKQTVDSLETVWQVAAVADFDGDGKTDILFRNSNGKLLLWIMDGAEITSRTSLGSAPTAWHVAAAADFDGDGKADILFRQTNGLTAIWFIGDGPKVRSKENVDPPPTSNWQVAGTGDFNGDGKADILLRRSSDGFVTLWEMNGAQAIAKLTVRRLSTDWTVNAVRDVDGDGRADIVFRHTNGNLVIWTMDGAVIKQAASIKPPPPTNWQIQP